MAAQGRDVRQLLLQVDASVALAQRNLGALASQVDRDATRMDRSLSRIDGATSRLDRAFNGLRNTAGALGITLGAAGVAAGVRGFLGYADAAKTLEAQLRLATQSSGNFAQAQEDVRRIASETRSGIEETSNLYSTFQRNARELGVTQQEAARATETVSKSFQISGASAAEASGGMRQFLQAIQSGRLRGEEFNSVMENAPRLARLLADSLGVTIGQLRAMAGEGELTGDKLMAALTDRKFTAAIDEEFRELPVTFDQAMTLVNNAAVETFGAFDRGGRFSEAIASFILSGTGGMEDLANSAEQAGIEIRASFEALGDVFEPLWEGGKDVFNALGIEAMSLGDTIAGLLQAWDDAANRIRPIREDEFSLVGMLTGPNQRGDLAGQFRSRLNTSRAAGQDDATARAIGLRARGGRSIADNSFQRYLNEPGRYDLFGNDRTSRPRPTGGGGGGGSSRRSRGGGSRRGRTPAPARPGDAMDPRNSAESIRQFVALQEALDDIRDGGPAEIISPEDPDRIAAISGGMDEVYRLLDGMPEVPDLGEMLTVEDQRRLDAFVHGFNRDLADGLAQAIVYGENLGDVLTSVIQRAAFELISSGLLDLLSGRGFGGTLASQLGGGKGGKGGGNPLGFIGDLFGSIFGRGTGKASGGPVYPGMTYPVGERGTEMFSPKVPGVIIPNHRLGGGGGGAVEVLIRSDNEMFQAQVVRISGAVVAQSAPGIANQGAAKALSMAGRRGLP